MRNEIPDLTIEEAELLALAGRNIELNDGRVYVASEDVFEAI